MRYDWALFLPTGILIVAWALASFVQTYVVDPSLNALSWLTSDPSILGFIRVAFTFRGLDALGFGIFIVACSLTSYRRGEKWAWYTFLYIPVYLVGDLLLAGLDPFDVTLIVALLILSLLGLLLPYRKFFPKKVAPTGERSIRDTYPN